MNQVSNMTTSKNTTLLTGITSQPYSCSSGPDRQTHHLFLPFLLLHQRPLLLEADKSQATSIQTHCTNFSSLQMCPPFQSLGSVFFFPKHPSYGTFLQFKWDINGIELTIFSGLAQTMIIVSFCRPHKTKKNTNTHSQKYLVSIVNSSLYKVQSLLLLMIYVHQ